MPAKPLSQEDLIRTAATLAATGGNRTRAAAELGVTRSTMQHRVRLLEAAGMLPGLTVAEPPPVGETVEELLARKKATMRRASAHEEWAKLIDVRVHEDAPIGLLLVGDPHVDDDHCDIERLEADLTTVGRTAGFYVGHVGDLTNNWVGRLARLYANQSTTFGDGLRLTEWMLGLAPTLFLVNGNHDLWGQGMDLLRFIARQANVGINQAHGARLALRWPSGAEIRIHARHDFPGFSQYSSTHGMKRELLWGHRDHVLVAGHTHVDEARVEPSIDGDAHWLFRVSGYKVIDDFAKERGFRPHRMAPSTALVIDPTARVPAERVKPFWDTETAADYLTWLRSRRARSSPATAKAAAKKSRR